jgi:uncharacterized membrane protein
LETHVLQWLELLARWFHLVAGAAWIGTSFYFVWLNHSFRPPLSPRPGVDGEVWSVHGGGFYRVERFEVAPERLPETLHWFKWEAYITWVTGACLLVLVYYLGSGTYLRDPAVAKISQTAAVGVGVGAIVAGWLVYDRLCRSPLAARPSAFGGAMFLFVAAAAFGLSQVLSGRAAYIHVGAILGTIMAGNVFFVIIPSQRAMVEAMGRGEVPDAAQGRHAAMRSLHNNYFTLPVLFVMISNHYPFTYGHRWNWLVLAGVTLAGVLLRHFENLRYRGRREAWIVPAALAGMVTLAIFTRPSATEAGKEEASFAEARAVLERRCVACHSAVPTHDAFPTAPVGVTLDTPEEILRWADRIHFRAVETQTMPMGNATGMTAKERAILDRWYRAGAAPGGPKP